MGEQIGGYWITQDLKPEKCRDSQKYPSGIFSVMDVPMLVMCRCQRGAASPASQVMENMSICPSLLPRLVPDQLSCLHDAPGKPLPLRPNNADFPQELSPENHPSCQGGLIPSTSFHKKSSFGIRDPFLHSPCSRPNITTLRTPTCPLSTRNSAATSEKMRHRGQTARHVLRVTCPTCVRLSLWTL